MTHAFFHTLVHVVTHMISSGSVTLRMQHDHLAGVLTAKKIIIESQ